MTVELCLSGKSTSLVAAELGLRHELVSRWKREYEQRKEGSFSGHGKPALSAEQAEIAKLKKQLREADKIYLYLEDGRSEIYNNLVKDLSIFVGADSKLESFVNHFQKVSFLQQNLA